MITPFTVGERVVGVFYVHLWLYNMLNINYLSRTRIIASLPCEIVFWSPLFFLLGGLDAYYVFAFGEVGE